MSGDAARPDRRSELRRWARLHHPDVGGELATYLAGVERIERRWAVVPTRPGGRPPPLLVVRSPWPVRLTRHLRRRLRHRGRPRTTVL